MPSHCHTRASLASGSRNGPILRWTTYIPLDVEILHSWCSFHREHTVGQAPTNKGGRNEASLGKAEMHTC